MSRRENTRPPPSAALPLLPTCQGPSEIVDLQDVSGKEEGVRSPFCRMVWNSQSLKAEAGVGMRQAGEAEQAQGRGVRE